MKKIDNNKMAECTASGDIQDFGSGVLCGVAIGLSVGTGGWSLGLAIAGCAILFGDY